MRNRLLCILLCMVVLPAFSSKVLLGLTQTVPPPSFIIAGNIGVAYYKVTNNTPRAMKNITVVDLPAGVFQDPAGSGLSPEGLITCRSTFDLAANGGSCILKLNIIANQMTRSIQSGPKVCENGRTSRVYCSTPHLAVDILMVNKLASTNVPTPTLSINPSTVTLPTGALTPIVVTNNSNQAVNNVHADFSSTALEDKVQVVDLDQTEQCKHVIPGGSCTLHLITYEDTPVNPSQFTIKGSNSKHVTATASIIYAAPNPLYTTLMQDVLLNADLWAEEPRILSASYAFQGISGTTNGEHFVTVAGGGWNIISTPGAIYSAFTSANDVASMVVNWGYPTYYQGAMPICFSWPVLPTSVHRKNFKLTLNTGKTVYPAVISIMPNAFYNERSCLVAFGPFGNRIPPGEPGAVYPTHLEIINQNNAPLKLVGKHGPVSIVGQRVACGHGYAPLGGPSLLAAKLSVTSAVGQDAPFPFNGAVPNDGIAVYGASKAIYRLRMYTSGGFARGYFTPDKDVAMSLMPTDYNTFFRIKVVADGITTWLYTSNTTYTIPGYGNITISGLATLAMAGTPLNDAYVADSNNYIDIMLYGDLEAMRKITQLDIPTTGTNPETGTPYQSVYGPGGPGNHPTLGVTYTSAGPAVEMPVTLALDDPNTVTYP